MVGTIEDLERCAVKVIHRVITLSGPPRKVWVVSEHLCAAGFINYTRYIHCGKYGAQEIHINGRRDNVMLLAC